MEGYNSKQKMYITIAVTVFIVINLIAVVLALPYLNKGSVKGIYTDSLSASSLINGNIEKELTIKQDENISTREDSLYLNNVNFKLLALPQADLRVEGNYLNINSGIYYLESISEVLIKSKIDFRINPDSKVFFDSLEGNIYILSGSVDAFARTFYAGFAVNLNSTEFQNNIFDKTTLLLTNKAKEMNALLAKKTLFVPELNFIATPNIEIANNILEETVSTSFYKVEGKVDASSHVFINYNLIEISTAGEFSSVVDLNEGLNNINVTIVDEVGNTKQVFLNISYTK